MLSSRLKKVEQVGAGPSLACAVHCTAIPALVALLPLMGDHLARAHWIEAVVIGAAAVIGVVTLGTGLRRHGRFGPLLLFGLGLAVILLGHAVLPHALSEVATVLGALMLAGGQFCNWRLMHPDRPAHPR